MDGRAIEFTDADLQASAQAYDPAKHEAPLVVGHPKIDAPAYGWVNALNYADGLQALPHQVDAQFAELVAAGRFKKISASFYLPDAANNPVPGVYYLRHVGFLGAAAPAVKGLKSAAFADTEQGVIEFADWGDVQQASLLRSLRDWIISKFGLDEANKALPGYAVDDVQTAAAQPETMPAMSYAEQQETSMNEQETAALAAREAKIKSDQAALDAQRAEFAEREKAVKTAEAAAQRKAIAEFVEGLVKAGKILPRDRAGLVAYMAGPNEAGVIEFAEGADKKTATPDGWLRGFLAALPKQVDYAEHSAAGSDDQAANFAAPAGYGVDPSRLELHNKALAWQAAHPNTTYDAAIAAVSR